MKFEIGKFYRDDEAQAVFKIVGEIETYFWNRTFVAEYNRRGFLPILNAMQVGEFEAGPGLMEIEEKEFIGLSAYLAKVLEEKMLAAGKIRKVAVEEAGREAQATEAMLSDP